MEYLDFTENEPSALDIKSYNYWKDKVEIANRFNEMKKSLIVLTTLSNLEIIELRNKYKALDKFLKCEIGRTGYYHTNIFQYVNKIKLVDALHENILDNNKHRTNILTAYKKYQKAIEVLPSELRLLLKLQ